MNKKTILLVIIGYCLLAPLSADPVALGLYQLHNGTNGVAPPDYGLRLDGLLTGNHFDDFTFNFDAAGSAMFMQLTSTQIRIFGTAWGGLDIGTTYSNPVFWDIDFTFTMYGQAPGDDDLIVSIASGTGTITNQSNTSQVFNLVDYPGMFPYTFRLGDEDNDLGHRGFAGVSGWGWLAHDGPTGNGVTAHLAASDWGFTATPVPEPSTLILLTSALVGLGFRYSLRKRIR